MTREVEEEGFLARWSRLKRKERRRDLPEQRPQPSPREEAAAEADKCERLPVEELPDPDSLAPDADFSVFLREGVPEALKQRALRRLWRSNPIIRTVDMLDDYCEDFTDAATVVAGLRTAVDKGKEAYERLRRELAALEDEGADPPASGGRDRGREETSGGGEVAEKREDEPDSGRGGKSNL